MSLRPSADASPPAYIPTGRWTSVRRSEAPKAPNESGKKSKKGLAFAIGMVAFWATLLAISLHFTPW